MAKDKKIYKLNASGTVGVSLTKSMRDAGYSAGTPVEWEAVNDGFLLKRVKAPEQPVEATTVKAEASPAPQLQTP